MPKADSVPSTKPINTFSTLEAKPSKRAMDQINADIDEAAAIEFEPWTDAPDRWRPPSSNIEWLSAFDNKIPVLRIAWAVLHKSKPELIEIHRKLSFEEAKSAIDGIDVSASYLEQMLEILNCARARLLTSLAAHSVEADKRKKQRGKARIRKNRR
jgi:hypothetical protein